MTFFFEAVVVEPRRPNGMIALALIDRGVCKRRGILIATCTDETAYALWKELGSALSRDKTEETWEFAQL